MKRLLTGFTVALVAAVWMLGSSFFFNSIAAGAQDTGAAKCMCGKHWKGHHGHHHLWKKLNLTDAQKKEMFSIRLDARAKVKPLVQKLKEGREQLRALPKGQFDEAKVRSIAKGQADTLVQIIVEKERMKSMMYAVLTPEQRAKAEQMREKWKARHGKEAEHKD
jgi:Spy/CpxP family protein refolding chaperone